ncbi:single-stranded telomeric DNA-binding/mRNA-binding protein [Martiniozyma asiatica (nom. inval.)]|nr:single-stranded telomeric DNA-binding/mRNA-binding protein [Martiniozyma asiatica]
MEIDRERSRSPQRDSHEMRDRSPGRERESYRPSYRGGHSHRDRGDRAPRGGSNYEQKTNRRFENSIFIGNLPFECDWYHLKDHFASIGDIVRADIVTARGRSKGMGTVEFKTRDDAEKAINSFDRSNFMGREIFVREDMPPPQKEFRERRGDRYGGRDGGDRYGGRDGGDRYGGRDGGDRYGGRDGGDRYGGDRYGGDRYGGDRYGGDRDRDQYRQGPPPRRSFRERESFRGPPAHHVEGFEVFVGNLPFSLRWQDLKDMFRECGDILRADVRENAGGRSRGYGTVVFANEEGAINAVTKFNGHNVMDRSIDVRHGKFSKLGSGNAGTTAAAAAPAIRKDGLSLNTELTLGVTGDGPESNKIFVANLPWETADSDLFELFGSISKVLRAELQYGRGARPSGNAVVEVDSEISAQQVIQQLNGYDYGNRRLRLSFARFPTSEELEALKAEIEEAKMESEAAANAAADAHVDAAAAPSELAEESTNPMETDQHPELVIAGSGAAAAAAAAAVASETVTADHPADVVDDADMIEE